jgi:hypothetical protein
MGVADAEMMDAVVLTHLRWESCEFDDGDAALAEFITIFATTLPALTPLFSLPTWFQVLIHHCWHFRQSGAGLRTLSILSRWEIGI